MKCIVKSLGLSQATLIGGPEIRITLAPLRVTKKDEQAIDYIIHSTDVFDAWFVIRKKPKSTSRKAKGRAGK